jgi:hypothetical protein
MRLGSALHSFVPSDKIEIKKSAKERNRLNRQSQDKDKQKRRNVSLTVLNISVKSFAMKNPKRQKSTVVYVCKDPSIKTIWGKYGQNLVFWILVHPSIRAIGKNSKWESNFFLNTPLFSKNTGKEQNKRPSYLFQKKICGKIVKNKLIRTIWKIFALAKDNLGKLHVSL